MKADFLLQVGVQAFGNRTGERSALQHFFLVLRGIGFIPVKINFDAADPARVGKHVLDNVAAQAAEIDSLPVCINAHERHHAGRKRRTNGVGW